MDNHVSVLLHESVEGLNVHSGETVVDATLGLGGHSNYLSKIVGKEGTVIGIEVDTNALSTAKKILATADAQFHFVLGNFKDIDEHLSSLKLSEVDGILFDLGWNSTQMNAGRGLSFRADDPLIMTLSATPDEGAVTAKDIITSWSETDLAEIIRTLGEERFAGSIAHAIVMARKAESIDTARELAQIISDAVPPWYRNGKTHPATKTFQALRILVNDELSTLTLSLDKAFALLKKGGRISVISFHSLEDGLVKRIFKKLAHDKKATLITKKPIRPTRHEVQSNPRARSARLRIIEKI